LLLLVSIPFILLAASLAMSKRDQEDGLFDEDEDDSSDEGVVAEPPLKKRKTTSMIDDAAEESGEDDGDEDDEEDDDEDNNDYVKDGFVVDEEEEDKKKDDLEDSDDEDEDEEDGAGKDSARKLKKVRKMRQYDRLDEEDLDLIREAQGVPEMPERGPEPPQREHIVAHNEAELRRGLFYDSGDEEQQQQQQRQQQQEVARQKARVERYDEDGMDDWIIDDIGDQGEIMASERRGLYNDEDNREINEAQLHEASEIFGTDYLDFVKEEQPDEEEEDLLGKYKERGVGVDYGLDSDEEVLSDEDDDDDLFKEEDDEEMDGKTAQQKAEALRLKREKRQLAKAERRRQAQLKKTERRKAQLRRAFEPVQLVENFCTDRDDDIRQTDVPERFYDRKTPFHGSEEMGMTTEEKTEASWIVSRVPEIAAEYASAVESDQQEAILQAIANALRYMHMDKLEPAFIKRYRKDYVTSAAVRENLYAVMDQDNEWDRVLSARHKVEGLLEIITVASDGDASVGADHQKLQLMQEELKVAKEQLDQTTAQESGVKAELEVLGGGNDEDDDDEELFGDDDDKEEVSIFLS